MGILDALFNPTASSPQDVNQAGLMSALLGAAGGALSTTGATRLPQGNGAPFAAAIGGGFQGLGNYNKNRFLNTQTADEQQQIVKRQLANQIALGRYNMRANYMGWPGIGGQSGASSTGATPTTGAPVSDPGGYQSAASAIGVPSSSGAPAPSPTSPGPSISGLPDMRPAIIGDMLVPGAGKTILGKQMLGANETIPYLQEKAAATAPLAVDIANYKSAVQAGNQNLALMWANKARYDANIAHTASMSGTTTQIDPLTGRVVYSFNPTKGTIFQNGAEGLAPGAANAARTLANAQGAGEESGKLAYTPFTTVTPTGPNAGQETKTLGKNLFPDLGMNPALRGANGAASNGASAGPVTKLSPATEEMSKSAGEQAGKNNAAYQNEAELAKDQNTQIEAIRNAASTFGPGKFANVRGEFLNFLNSAPGGAAFAESAFGKNWQQQLGSYQEGTKIGIQLQAAATRVLGAREAQQIFQWMGKSMPNLTMSAGGLEKVSSFMKGMNDYKIARAQMAQEKFNQNDAVGVNSTRDQFIKNSDPMFYIMADSAPEDRVELLRNMGPDKAKAFVTKWDAAVKAGYAPGIQ